MASSVSVIIANLHDSVILFGFFAFFKREFSLSVLVASPLVMWLGVSREHFIKPKKQIEGANEEGAVV